MGLLDGAVVLITGGAAGQGQEHAVFSAREGADVLVIDVHPTDGGRYADVEAGVRAAGREVLAVQADVTSQEQLDAAVAAGVERFGHIDKAIVNAGIYRSGHVSEMGRAEWDLVMNVNLTGAWQTIKAVAPVMSAQGSGSIVVIASVDGLDPVATGSAYGASKAAAISLARHAALDLGPAGIRVNAIAPGLVDTDMLNSQSFYDYLAGGEGLGTRQHLLDYGTTKTVLKDATVLPAEEIAKVAAFLNSDLAASVTGVVIPVDAGFLLLPHNRK